MENINFTKIEENKKNIDENFSKLLIQLEDLKKIYGKLSGALNSQSTYLGIDSFNFQIKLMDTQLENFQKIYLMIKNRMYKDYYKIYRSLRKYLETNMQKTLKESIFPAFKDLEAEKEYDFKYIPDLRNEYITYIRDLEQDIGLRLKSLQEFKDSDKKGLNVKNYILEEELTINILREKMELYKKYLETSNFHHNLYLINILKQLEQLDLIIQKDIKLKLEFEKNLNKKTLKNLNTLSLNKFINPEENEKAEDSETIENSENIKFSNLEKENEKGLLDKPDSEENADENLDEKIPANIKEIKETDLEEILVVNNTSISEESESSLN